MELQSWICYGTREAKDGWDMICKVMEAAKSCCTACPSRSCSVASLRATFTYSCCYYTVEHLSNGANVFFFLSSLPLLPQPTRQCLAPICNLSTLKKFCITDAGLPIRMIGEVLRQPKEDEHGSLSIKSLWFVLNQTPSLYPNHRLDCLVELSWPLSCVHSVMMVFSGQLAEGGIHAYPLYSVYPLDSNLTPHRPLPSKIRKI
jgi:hypothetical protein